MNSGKTAGGPLPPAGHKPQLLFVSRERNGGAPLLALFEKWAAALQLMERRASSPVPPAGGNGVRKDR